MAADLAYDVKHALETDWATVHSSWTATLHVDDDYKPTVGEVTLLVVNDGGPKTWIGTDYWSGGVRGQFRKPLLRLTAFAKGRSDALDCVESAAKYVADNRIPLGIQRVTDISDPLITRDRGTGAFLASVLLPVVVKPT